MVRGKKTYCKSSNLVVKSEKLERRYYTCQLFLRYIYKREIFILGVLGFFEDDTIISEDSRITPRSFEEVRSLPKAKLSSPSLGTRINASSLPVLSLHKSEIARKVLSFIHFAHGFRSLHGSELTYFWKLCQARRQQLTFFNQA